MTVMVSELSVSGSETYLVIAYTKLSLCLTFSLIRTRATSLDSLLLGAQCGLWGCKNGPAPFPGRVSYKAD